MARALFLAERGRGTTTPNPVVGAVVVSSDGIVVGQGAHRVAGGPHAEVFALDAAGIDARGATLYCTLEPCSHTGRTGPCAARVAAAGITRVVVALDDPNPRVAGGGFAYLRAHGIEVVTGVERDQAARQNAPFITWIASQRPHVTMKVAVSADGFVGSERGNVNLTGPAMDRTMHQQRAGIDAIAVGSSTVLADNPQLTARLAYRQRPLTRVVFDRRARVTPSARLFETLEAGPVIMFIGPDFVSSSSADALRRAGAQVVAVAPEQSVVAALRELAIRDVLALLVEGGPTLQRAFWDAGVVDRVQIVETPAVLGSGIAALLPTPGVAVVTTRQRGADVLKEWDVHRAD